MARPKLKNLPLVEAILEIRWKLQRVQQMALDPHYNLLIGRLFDRLQPDYPEHEPLPTSRLPEDMVPQTVQHRFRKAKNDWPLVQVGPGIATVNETQNYDWNDFRTRCLKLVSALYDAYPVPEQFAIESAVLRYINAVEFDEHKESVYGFLNQNMGIEMGLPASLFESGAVKSLPLSLIWQSAFSCDKPVGLVTLKFDTGKMGNKAVLRWETFLVSLGVDMPSMPKDFEPWLNAAHDVHDDWFFKLIAGKLQERFES